MSNDTTVYDEDYTGPRWRYGMRNRPPAPMCQPKGRIIGADKERGPDTDPRFRYGTIDYPFELTPQDLYDFELIFAEKIETTSTYLAVAVGQEFAVREKYPNGSDLHVIGDCQNFSTFEEADDVARRMAAGEFPDIRPAGFYVSNR